MTSVILKQEDVSTPARTYSYRSRPRAVPARKRYREHEQGVNEEGAVHYGNLMYDRRVVRGNTYAAQTLPWSPEPDPVEIQKQREAHRKMLARKRAKEEEQVHTPVVDDSKSRVDVQTELYLEEIADRIIENDTECQTDAFLERPDSPLFIPQKTGADAATQIEEGELFEFDIEVKPMLEVLVGKTLEQALLEVSEEEELANLQAHQYAYQELHNAEIAEVHRLEERQRRRKEEKERRMMQQVEIQERQTEVTEKIAARAFALQYLSNLIPSVFTNLQNKGFFYDQTESDVEEGFLPYLMDSVEELVKKRLQGRIMTDLLIREVAGKRLEDFAENQMFDQYQIDNIGQRSFQRNSSKLFGSGSAKSFGGAELS
ncbi:radial spoke head protein 3 homolog [Elgaria multicarinata webbii]|uniref:radial spoke head protein 3 homolog n=1 Tax=Elgaria multicarinata webbii TaxID=159646 RepID=UPI002FCD3C77